MSNPIIIRLQSWILTQFIYIKAFELSVKCIDTQLKREWFLRSWHFFRVTWFSQDSHYLSINIRYSNGTLAVITVTFIFHCGKILLNASLLRVEDFVFDITIWAFLLKDLPSLSFCQQVGKAKLERYPLTTGRFTPQRSCRATDSRLGSEKTRQSK